MSVELITARRGLPPLPFLAHEVLLATTDADATVGSIAEKIAREPAIAARVVAIANSAFCSSLTPVTSIEGAVIRLGLNRVRMLTLSILLAEQFNRQHCPGFRAEDYWLRATSTAHCAARLARELPELDAESAYLAGLLHNIGVMLLARLFPQQMSTLFSRHASTPAASLSRLMREELLTDYHAAGHLLLTEWGLPADIAAAAATLTASASFLARLIHFSAAWTALDYQTLPLTPAPPLPTELLPAIALECLGAQQHLLVFARLLACC
jgi:HD-like signal output (HDOD) protein